VTWAFAYLAALLVGLVLAVVTGLLRDLHSLARQRLVVPHPDQHYPFIALMGRRLAIGLILVGAVGLTLGARRVPEHWTTLVLAIGAGVLGFLFACAFFRRARAQAKPAERAVVVREIAPGGYGQVRIERGKETMVMAAQSVDAAAIPAGAAVEVVDSAQSVLKVRRQSLA
jgi:hypothetical protein